MIKLYRADIAWLPDEEAVEKNMVFLDETRKRKVHQCRNPEDKKRSLLAGCLIRAGVKEWRGEESGLQGNPAPLSLSYAFSEHGKPYLRGEKNPYFNLSHSGNYVACAFSDEEIGIDIQVHRKRKGDIAKRFFSREDRQLLDRMAEEGMDPEAAFYRIWTIKESYMKLTGEGMGQGLDASVIEEPGAGGKEGWPGKGKSAGALDCGRIRKKGEAGSYAYFKCYEEHDGTDKYSLTVCSYGKIDDILRREIHMGKGGHCPDVGGGVDLTL